MNRQKNKSYTKGFQDAIVGSISMIIKKDIFRTYNKKNPDYVFGYHEGSKSE